MDRMIRGIHLTFIATLLLQASSAAAEVPVILTIEVADSNFYIRDETDYAKLATTASVVNRAPAANFDQGITMADIISVNGVPAKGILFGRWDFIRSTPTPSPGQNPADVARSGIAEWFFEILQPDGTPVGSIMAAGFNGGPPPPGAPATQTALNMTVTGGTGAFLGARGQAGLVVGRPTPSRTAQSSVREDPSLRRLIGGNQNTQVVYLLPAVRPEIIAAFHSDFTPVTESSPAIAGETVILRVTSLGPTRPTLITGEVFPLDRPAIVNSPVDVLVGGRPVEVGNKIGWPNTTDVFRVDFQMPGNQHRGFVPVAVVSAWIPSARFDLPVR
jgi:uncharacterized protein (TIGR03437 family)